MFLFYKFVSGGQRLLFCSQRSWCHSLCSRNWSNLCTAGMVCGVHVSLLYFSKTLVHSDHPNGAWGRFRICDDGVQTSNCFNNANVLKELCHKIHQNSNSCNWYQVGWNIENAAQNFEECIKNTKYQSERRQGWTNF